MEKFSILTANFNKLPFLLECADSVINQTYRNFEWIIVDDASTDGSYEYLKSLPDERIRVIRNAERMYCSSCYRLALSQAQGEICGVLDADDALDHAAITEILRKYRENPDVEWIYTQHYWCDKKLKIHRLGLSAIPRPRFSFIDMSKIGKHCYSHWRTFRRRLTEKGELFVEGLKYAVDKNLGFILEELGPGGFYPKALYYYRYYKDNMSLQFAAEQKQTWKALAEEHRRLRAAHKREVYRVKVIR